MLNDRSSTLALLKTRRSGRPRDLGPPGPSAAELAEILAIAMRSPDHGKLHPWRFVHVAESQAQAEEELGAALFETRRHMVHARSTHNPADYRVESSRTNPWNDPLVSHEAGVRVDPLHLHPAHWQSPQRYSSHPLSSLR